ncbi:transcription initiation factor IIA subunit 1 isoform X2 [Venturia canescens]|uniref:transcription initiation factor IIA subunit 1 isoform X2 n=1 Tax=Venturia canescens TaxID=32260 RepID=UPI001C9C82EB|nr:transcription initiation factor IIA subunit 1 isoform X2 [Venturia canescens]
MALSQTSVLKLYNTVIEDVIAGVRESFLDEGVDEQVLQELKQIWESKLLSNKAVELNPDPPEPQPPQLASHKSSNSSKASNAANHFAQQQQQQQVATASSTTAPVQQPPTVIQQQQQAPAPPQQQIQPQPQQVQQQIQPQSVPQLQQQQQTTRTIQQHSTPGIPIQQHSTIPVQQQVVTAPPTLYERQVPIQITLPGPADSADGKPKVLTIQVPASAIQGNQLHTILTGPVITAAMGFPTDVASRLLQQHVDKTLQGQAALAPMQINQPIQVITQNTNNVQPVSQLPVQSQGTQGNMTQLDGPMGDSSDDDEEEEEDDNDDDDDDIDKDEEENDEAGACEEEPLNSEDDVTDDDPTDLFDTDNVVVCQYDKITRSRNKWKFYLKDGIMNLSGKDYVFQKANGDAEW